MIETHDEIAWRILPSNDRTTMLEDWVAFKYRAAVSVAIAAERTRVKNMEDEIARLREALEPFAVQYDAELDDYPDETEWCPWHDFVTIGDLRKARAALQTDGATDG